MGAFIKSIGFFICISGLLVVTDQARIKRCYVCRSRGDLGDCKDPFAYNATTVEMTKAVEAAPCASGWCAKVIEGKGDEYAIATERMCLQRPPGDEEQRCGPTLYLTRRVMMCFCKGDLCNAASVTNIQYITLTACFIGCLLKFYWFMTLK